MTARSPRHAVEDLLPLVRQHAAEAERDRRLSTPVFEAMRDAGLYRMLVPTGLGGLGLDLREALEIVERIAEVDSAAGWNLQICAVSSPGLGALLSPEGAEEIFGDPNSVVAGGFNPPGMATRADGGYILNGRWAFVSGCLNATWLVDPSLVITDGQPEMLPEGHPLMMALLYPARDATIIETWNPLGMRGTGSHDIAVENLFVPERHATPLRPFDDLPPLFRTPTFSLGLFHVALGNAVVSLGIARAAIDEAVALCTSKVPAFQQHRPVDRGVVHAHLGRAEAALSSARAYFYGAIDDALAACAGGARPSPRQRLHLQLAASQAAEASAAAVDHVHAAVGSSGVREEQAQFARHFRDVHTITQHAFCSGTRFESMGQVMLGLETDWAFFWF